MCPLALYKNEFYNNFNIIYSIQNSDTAMISIIMEIIWKSKQINKNKNQVSGSNLLVNEKESGEGIDSERKWRRYR